MNGKVYSNKNNELITTPPKDLEKIKTGGKDLEMSDEVLNGDLFRFYNNPDFKKLIHQNMTTK